MPVSGCPNVDCVLRTKMICGYRGGRVRKEVDGREKSADSFPTLPPSRRKAEETESSQGTPSKFCDCHQGETEARLSFLLEGGELVSGN